MIGLIDISFCTVDNGICCSKYNQVKLKVLDLGVVEH